MTFGFPHLWCISTTRKWGISHASRHSNTVGSFAHVGRMPRPKKHEDRRQCKLLHPFVRRAYVCLLRKNMNCPYDFWGCKLNTLATNTLLLKTPFGPWITSLKLLSLIHLGRAGQRIFFLWNGLVVAERKKLHCFPNKCLHSQQKVQSVSCAWRA